MHWTQALGWFLCGALWAGLVLTLLALYSRPIDKDSPWYNFKCFDD